MMTQNKTELECFYSATVAFSLRNCLQRVFSYGE